MPPLLHTGPSCLQLTLVFQSGGEWVTPLAQSDAPVGDPASRVICQRGVESRNRMTELEGMQQRHRVVEFQLCFLIARSREVNNAESLRRSVGMLLGDADAHEKYKGEHDSTVWQGRWHV